MKPAVPGGMRIQLDDCWNRIGVRGDLSCPELQVHIHCRNCPVHAAAAAALLDVPLPEDHLRRWTAHLALEPPTRDLNSLSLVLFRVGTERFALPTLVFDEIADPRPIHSLPQRRGLVLGVCNFRGELRVCVSLHRLLGIETVGEQRKSPVETTKLLVLAFAGSRAVIPVDEVLGIFRFPQSALRPAPATVAKASASFSRALFDWQQQPVGLLDENLLFQRIDRNLPSSTST